MGRMTSTGGSGGGGSVRSIRKPAIALFTSIFARCLACLLVQVIDGFELMGTFRIASTRLEHTLGDVMRARLMVTTTAGTLRLKCRDSVRSGVAAKQ